MSLLQQFFKKIKSKICASTASKPTCNFKEAHINLLACSSIKVPLEFKNQSELSLHIQFDSEDLNLHKEYEETKITLNLPNHLKQSSTLDCQIELPKFSLHGFLYYTIQMSKTDSVHLSEDTPPSSFSISDVLLINEFLGYACPKCSDPLIKQQTIKLTAHVPFTILPNGERVYASLVPSPTDDLVASIQFGKTLEDTEHLVLYLPLSLNLIEEDDDEIEDPPPVTTVSNHQSLTNVFHLIHDSYHFNVASLTQDLEHSLKEVIEQDINDPSISVTVLFNGTNFTISLTKGETTIGFSNIEIILDDLAQLPMYDLIDKLNLVLPSKFYYYGEPVADCITIQELTKSLTVEYVKNFIGYFSNLVFTIKSTPPMHCSFLDSSAQYVTTITLSFLMEGRVYVCSKLCTISYIWQTD